jgi:nicotinamidase-related amidase
MALTTLDAKTALVLIDLQNDIVAEPAVPRTGAEVVARSKELADAPQGRDEWEPTTDSNSYSGWPL